MALSQTETQSQIIELSAEAFKTFCNYISGVFGLDAECKQQEAVTETVKGLKKRFKKLSAVNSVKAEGTLDGAFQFVFDREGLFTLAGVIVTSPEEKISENRTHGTAKEADAMSDAVAEVGNLLIGSWERVFRGELNGHGCFVQTDTFIGNPWDKPENNINLSSDEEYVFVPCEMTIKPYTTFNCGVIFPKTIFDGTFPSEPEQAAESDDEEKQKKTQDQKADAEKPSERTATKEDAEETNKAGTPAETKEVKSEKKKPAPKKTEDKNKTAAQIKPKTTDEQKSSDADIDASDGAVEEKTTPKKTEDKNKTATQIKPKATDEQKSSEADINASDDAVEEKTAATEEIDSNNEQPISNTIQKMAESPATLPGEQAQPPETEAQANIETSASSGICAKDIMQKDIVWASPDDSVEQALSKMQQHKAGYMIVGQDGISQGFISKSDLTAAISPYLRPAFAKWHRPLDDATLQIRVKWIMSKPVNTISPETSLADIMENMLQFPSRCLPVADQEGKVQGLVTTFDIFKALLNSSPAT